MILITGATSGIGEATARRFAAMGQSLILIGRREDRLDALHAELSKTQGVKVHPFSLDVSQTASVQNWAKEHGALLKQVKILVNSAGLALGFKPVQDYEAKEWDTMLDINVKGLLAMTRELIPYFKENRDGHIVNLGSTAGHYAYPNGNIYCASKAAVRMLTECMRLDLNGTGIRVTEISPGMVETEFSKVRFSGDTKKADSVYAGMTPLTADDIAETIVWCTSRPRHVNVQELIIYPTDQASPTLVKRH
ncbi:MAG: SDR family NAD(P)-dependent oxidoreductase [Oligoflexia bacterium]|nr:SDR family NAD(P)-dependent oxidoreductase [Oligoflexia bacterium]